MFDEWVKFKKNEVLITTNNVIAHPLMHQYAGIQCKHTSIDKKLVRLGISTSKYFDSDWWYSLWYRNDSNGMFVVPTDKRNIAETELRKHPDKLYMSQLKELLEQDLNALNKDYSNFEILDDVQEAYLHVKFLHNGIEEIGYVLWENCD